MQVGDLDIDSIIYRNSPNIKIYNKKYQDT